jgi:hypothetical protein
VSTTPHQQPEQEVPADLVTKAAAPASLSDTVVELLFHPIRWNLKRPLAIALTVLSILLLLCLALSCAPPLRNYLCEYVLDKEYWRANKQYWVPWIEFTRILSEMLLAVTVGSALYASSLISWVKRTAESTQAKREAELEGWHVELENSMKEDAKEYVKLFQASRTWQGWRSAFQTFFRMGVLALRLNRNITRGIPALYRRLILFGLYSNFPGGLYGLFSYLLVLVILFTKVFKFYLDCPIFQ